MLAEYDALSFSLSLKPKFCGTWLAVVCGPALLILTSDRVVGSICCRCMRVEFTVTRTSGSKVFVV